MSTVIIAAGCAMTLLVLVTFVPRRSHRSITRTRTTTPPRPASVPAPRRPVVPTPRTAPDAGVNRAAAIRLAHVRAAAIALADSSTGPAPLPRRSPELGATRTPAAGPRGRVTGSRHGAA